MTFSRDGKIVATASNDHTIKLWDVETGEERAALNGHTSFVNCLAFSPDGRTLVSGSYDGTVRFWRAASEDDVLARALPEGPYDQRLFYSFVHVDLVVGEIKRLGGRVIIDQEHPDAPVTHVYLTGSEVNDDTLRMLSPFRELQLLSLFNTNATGEGLKHLTECKQLKQLTLMGNAVNDQGVAAIKLFPTLTYLSIGMGVQVKRLDPDGRPMPIRDDPITDAGLAHLSDLTDLYYLAFDNTQITDTGLKHLRGLTGLNQLQFFRTPGRPERAAQGITELQD